MKRLVLFLMGGLLSIMMVSEAMATRGAMPHAYGTRATGLGSAFDAVSDDALSPAVYNPAGLTQIDDKRFDMELIFLRPILTSRIETTTRRTARMARPRPQVSSRKTIFC